MEEEISKVYQPSEVESKWYARWLEANCFDADEASTRVCSILGMFLMSPSRTSWRAARG
jgi:hypothetical protein